MTSAYAHPSDSPYAVSVASVDHIPDIVVLLAENRIANRGALSVEFPAQWFERAVKDLPIVIVRREGRLVAFLVSSSQDVTQHLPPWDRPSTAPTDRVRRIKQRIRTSQPVSPEGAGECGAASAARP